MNFDADIDDVFFAEFAVEIFVDGIRYSALLDQDLEVVDADGTITMVEYACTVKTGALKKGTGFTHVGTSWIAGQPLERNIDGTLMTWEITGA